jgi:hypothetical protein
MPHGSRSCRGRDRDSIRLPKSSTGSWSGPWSGCKRSSRPSRSIRGRSKRASACIDYLNYDRLGKAEVHKHLPDGGRQMQRFIAEHGIRPRLRLSSDAEHEARLFALAQRLDSEPDALLKEAIGDLLARYEVKAFGGLLATQKSPDGEQPLVHARLLSESVEKPLCGANDGPWSARGFDFERVTCRECQSLVLNP